MSTTISKVAYRAVWDSSNLAKGLMNTRSMFIEQKKILQSMQQPVDRYTQAQHNLANLLAKFPDLQKHKLQLEKQIERQYLTEEAAVRKLTETEKKRFRELMSNEDKIEARRARSRARLESSSRTFSDGKEWMTAGGGSSGGSTAGGFAMGAGLAKAAGAAAVAYGGYKMARGASGLLAEGAQAYKEVERVESALNVFSGSLAKSRDMMLQIRSLSAETGVSFAGLATGAKTMMLRDIDADKAIDLMRKIAIVTGGETDSMKSMALAMGQVNQAGRLMGQELIQLVNAGWTPLEEISKKTKIPMADLRKEMEAGRISYQMVADALDAAVSAGGRYYGFLESLEGTTARESDRAAAAWEEASARIGQALKPVSSLWARFSQSLASELSTIAGLLTPSSTVPNDPVESPAAARRAAAAARLQSIREREAAAFAAQDKALEEQRTMAEGGLLGSTAELTKKLMSEEDVARFYRIYNLLTDANKERAKWELSIMGTQADISSLLDDQTRQELAQVEALQKKVDLERKRKEMIEKATATTDRHLSEEAQRIKALVDLEMARKMGGMSTADYDRAVGDLFRDKSMRGGSLAQNMNVGSQEAYAFLAGVQDRSQREAAARHREQSNLQKALIEATKQVKAAIEALEPIGVAG